MQPSRTLPSPACVVRASEDPGRCEVFRFGGRPCLGLSGLCPPCGRADWLPTEIECDRLGFVVTGTASSDWILLRRVDDTSLTEPDLTWPTAKTPRNGPLEHEWPALERHRRASPGANEIRAMPRLLPENHSRSRPATSNDIATMEGPRRSCDAFDRSERNASKEIT
jgi:hypothetical protein